MSETFCYFLNHYFYSDSTNLKLKKNRNNMPLHIKTSVCTHLTISILLKLKEFSNYLILQMCKCLQKRIQNVNYSLPMFKNNLYILFDNSWNDK